MTNHTNDIVDQMAHDSFEELMDFVQALKGRSRRRGGASAKAKAHAENRALDCLLEAFEGAAGSYFEEAKGLIQDGNESETRKDKVRNYHRVLSRLTDHALLLSNLARPPLAAGIESQSQQCFNRNRALVENVMTIIGTRLGSFPLRFLIPSQSFRHVHFNYWPEICAIGIPPQVLARPSWNLSVLWHEIAGYYVALKRRELEEWAIALPDVWKDLREIYEQRSLYEVVRIEREGEGENRPYRITGYKVNANEEWKTDWLGEFFEDLFGVRALGGTMVEILADVLVQWYEHFDLGDAKHPPPNLRLEVALAYLGLVDGNAGETRNRLESRYGLEKLELQPFGDKYPNSGTAQTIAKFLKSKLDDMRSPPDNGEGPDLPGIIGRAHRRLWGEEEGEEEQLPQELYEGRDVETELPLDCRPVAGFIARIEAADDLKALLEVEFASVDMAVDSAAGAADNTILWPPAG